MKKFLFATVIALTTISAHAISVAYLLNPSSSGTYEVPVKNPELLGSAQFALKKVDFKKDGNKVSLKYLIPVELTGEKNFAEFEGTLEGGSGSLTYDENTMNCLTDQDTLMCRVAYQNLKFDQVKVDLIMTRKFKGEDLQRRLMVQREFSTDPVGVIKIKLK